MINSITVNYDGARPYRRVQEAVAKANELMRTDEFYTAIANHPRFALSSASSESIAELMRDARIIMKVDLYYALSPLYNIDGYDDTENPFAVHLNVWRIDRSVSSLCNSIVHGCVHAVNAQVNRFYLSQYYFGHGPATTPGKEKTAPYAIGAIAQRLVSNEDTVFLPLEHDPYISRFKTAQNAAPAVFASV
ncbi:MAG: hypothetical protein V4649_12430 [Bacteroidota bacterium]